MKRKLSRTQNQTQHTTAPPTPRRGSTLIAETPLVPFSALLNLPPLFPFRFSHLPPVIPTSPYILTSFLPLLSSSPNPVKVVFLPLPEITTKMDLNLPPLRDYSETELLALPPDSRLLFADNVHQGLLTYDNPPKLSRRRRVLHPKDALTPQQLQSALQRVRALRCLSHGLSAFSLYPTTDQQYRVNHFLWRAANAYSFEAREAAQLFQRNVFVVCMPAALFDFLTSVSWPQLESTILVILTNLAQGNRGMGILHSELAPCLSSKLDDYAGMSDPVSHADPHVFRLMLDLVMDRIVCMGPWVIPTSLCYLSASDMTQLLAHRYERSIFSTPEKFELVHTMMWNIYRDWQTYRQVLVKNGGRPRLEALELMARTISKGSQAMVNNGIRTLYQLAMESDKSDHTCQDISMVKRDGSTTRQRKLVTYISQLPTDVILGKLMPTLCEAYASDDKSKRRAATSTRVTEATPEVVSPVTVPFSLKSWVLEDHVMHQFYHSLDAEDEEMADAEYNTNGENSGQQQNGDPGDTSGQNEGVGNDAGDDDVGNRIGGGGGQGSENGAEGATVAECEVEVVASPRTLRRRLNEQGSFETVSGQASSSDSLGSMTAGSRDVGSAVS